MTSCPKRFDGKPHSFVDFPDTYLVDPATNNGIDRITLQNRRCIFCEYTIRTEFYDKKQVSANGEDDI